eukprot:2946203-Pleurochrysis_carterae.AAC.1
MTTTWILLAVLHVTSGATVPRMSASILEFCSMASTQPALEARMAIVDLPDTTTLRANVHAWDSVTVDPATADFKAPKIVEHLLGNGKAVACTGSGVAFDSLQWKLGANTSVRATAKEKKVCVQRDGR